MRKLNAVVSNLKAFGLRYTINLLSAILFYNRSIDRIIQIKENYLSDYMEEIFDVQNNDYAKNNLENLNSTIPVWQFWWQGTDNLPEVVKICMNSVEEKLKSEKINRVIITKDNYKNYVNIPDYIMQKVENGIISLTHFSDILRVCLLNKYGGIWIDATILLTDNLPSDVLDSSLFSIRLDKNKLNRKSFGQQLTKGRWAGFFWISSKNNKLFSFLERALFSYWKHHNYLIDYFIMNLLIDIAYKNVTSVKEQIDNIPYNNPDLYELSKIMNIEFNQEDFVTLKCNTSIFKLTYKEKFVKNNLSGGTTYFGKLYNQYLR